MSNTAMMLDLVQTRRHKEENPNANIPKILSIDIFSNPTKKQDVRNEAEEHFNDTSFTEGCFAPENQQYWSGGQATPPLLNKHT